MDELWIEYHEWLNARFAEKPGREPDGGGDVIVHDWSITSPLRTPREIAGTCRETVTRVQS